MQPENIIYFWVMIVMAPLQVFYFSRCEKHRSRLVSVVNYFAIFFEGAQQGRKYPNAAPTEFDVVMFVTIFFYLLLKSVRKLVCRKPTPCKFCGCTCCRLKKAQNSVCHECTNKLQHSLYCLQCGYIR